MHQKFGDGSDHRATNLHSRKKSASPVIIFSITINLKTNISINIKTTYKNINFEISFMIMYIKF